MKPKTPTVTELHKDWLSQIETDGPFLALPVVKDIWPQGVDRLGDADDRTVTFKQAYVQWQRAFDTYTAGSKSADARADYQVVNRAWIELVLDRLAGWQDLRLDADDQRLSALRINSPGGEITVRPSGALEGRDGELAVLVLLGDPTSDLRAIGLDGWAATEIDRMAALLRQARVEVGIVTDGQWWAVVWAKDGKPTGSGMVNALTWAEEPLLRDAFLTLIDQRRLRAKDPEQRLPRLFERSELEAEEITEALGTQVRRSVELLVQAFSEARLAAAAAGEPDPLTDEPDAVYQGAVTVMMRVVFLLFAEEREMLPSEQLYWDSYAIHELLDSLKHRAADGEEHLDSTHDAWHRLLAVSQALFGGVNYDEMRMPAYGGSLLDPARFPWLHATDSRGLRLKVSDRVMLHVFDSVQSVVVNKERRRISFRDIDVEQIGYIYEGLLGYTCHIVEDDVVLGFTGKAGQEPEIPLGVLEGLYENSTDDKDFAIQLTVWVKDHQPAATGPTVSAMTKLMGKQFSKGEEAELTRLLTPAAGGNPDLLISLVSWGNMIRRDLRNIPYVIPTGGLVLAETPSRKNAGAHYTPRSLAEEVVTHALEPLVYEPGPLETNDISAWKLKSSTAILDLKVVDIAAGSGAFLVAAARFLADRVMEAWTEEGVLSQDKAQNPKIIAGRAIREVIARCLYGADINPMAVEMCKLSLWLVSMDKSRPFSFVDDKIFCGNSLLGICNIAQIQALHLYPNPRRPGDLISELVDVRQKLDHAAGIRAALAFPVDEQNPMRSTRGKVALLKQARRVTADLRLIADGIVATGLLNDGKSNDKLDNAFSVLSWQLAQAFADDSTNRYRSKIEDLITFGLTPTVETDYHRWLPLHWVIEAPDVMTSRGGFDAVIGNPPFFGGKKISGAYGTNFREYLTNVIAEGRRGECDLVGYFFLRAQELVSQGCIGLLASESLSEGEARRVCLEPMLTNRLSIRRAIKRLQWPTEASVHVSLIWGTWRSSPPSVMASCDGALVDSINASLEPASRVSGSPYPLKSNAGLSFMGAILSGNGFKLSPAERRSLLESEPSAEAVIASLVVGSDVNQQPEPGSTGFVIDFGEESLASVRTMFPTTLARIETLVKPARDKVKKKQYRDRWWQFAERGRGLSEGLARVDRVHVLVLTSDTLGFVRLPSAAVFTNSLGVFLLQAAGDLAVLSSAPHLMWAMRWGSSLDAATRYTTSDVFETFPRPQITPLLESAGQQFERERSEIMVGRQLGLTSFYQLVNNRTILHDTEISQFRETVAEIDKAAMAAYGWEDIPLSHGFHEYRQIERWTVSPSARIEMLDRLLELNHRSPRKDERPTANQEMAN